MANLPWTSSSSSGAPGGWRWPVAGGGSGFGVRRAHQRRRRLPHVGPAGDRRCCAERVRLSVGRIPHGKRQRPDGRQRLQPWPMQILLALCLTFAIRRHRRAHVAVAPVKVKPWMRVQMAGHQPAQRRHRSPGRLETAMPGLPLAVGATGWLRFHEPTSSDHLHGRGRLLIAGLFGSGCRVEFVVMAMGFHSATQPLLPAAPASC